MFVVIRHDGAYVAVHHPGYTTDLTEARQWPSRAAAIVACRCEEWAVPVDYWVAEHG